MDRTNSSDQQTPTSGVDVDDECGDNGSSEELEYTTPGESDSDSEVSTCLLLYPDAPRRPGLMLCNLTKHYL